MAKKKFKANMRSYKPPQHMWLIVSTVLTGLGFVCSLGAVIMDNWFEIYCENDYNQPTPTPSYSLGLWRYCGKDVSWITNATTTFSPASPPNTWQCADINLLLTGPERPTWLQGSRSMQVSGCIACGLTFLVMLAHCFSPEEMAQGAAVGFAGSTFAAAGFFTGVLLTVFAAQNRTHTLVPPSGCSVPYMPSSYPITFIVISLCTSVLTALIDVLVSEGILSSKTKRGARVVRQVET